MGKQSSERHELSRAEALKGAANGRATRVARANAWARSIYAGMHTLARNRRVALCELTNDEIADYLRGPPFGITAPGSGELTGKLVHRALTRMGIDRTVIKKWRAKALQAADDFGVDDAQLMIFQLWHEWQRHEAQSYFNLRWQVGGEARPFVFEPVHPGDWVPPWVRDIVGPNGPREPNYALSLSGPPPTAHLVQALMGMFDLKGEDAVEQAERVKGMKLRQAQADAHAKDYEGHFDDPTDYAVYLDSLRQSNG